MLVNDFGVAVFLDAIPMNAIVFAEEAMATVMVFDRLIGSTAGSSTRAIFRQDA